MEYYETCQESNVFVVDELFGNFRMGIIGSKWNAQEVINHDIMRNDLLDLKKLSDPEQNCVLQILAFFAIGDVFVMRLIDYLLKNVKYKPWLSLEITKSAQEDIHAEVYILMIDYLAPDSKQKIIQGINEYGIAKKKLQWCEKIIGDIDTLLERHVDLSYIVYILIITELLFFSSSFATIYWFKSRNILNGLCYSNDFIARDESYHGEIGITIYKTLQHKLSESKAHEIMQGAVDIECEFADSIIPDGTAGMNRAVMKKYIRFIANDILIDLGYNKLFHDAVNPFTFMNKLKMERRTDSFYKKPTEYQSYAPKQFEIKDFLAKKLN